MVCGKDVIVMAYTAPSAVVTGQSITASLYNTYVKDNILDHESRIVTAGPAGLVSPFAGASAPSGWLLCDGTTTHSTTTYAALFAVVGYTYGGSGGTFGVPNLKGRTVIGVGVGADASPVTGVIGVAQGEAQHALSYGETGVPAHSHPISDPGHGHTNRVGIGSPGVTNSSDVLVRSNGGTQDAGFAATNATTTGITATGNNTASAATAHINVQPSLPLTYIIKY